MSTLDSKHVTSIISLIWKSAEDCTKYNLPGGRKEAVITLACVSMHMFVSALAPGRRREGRGGRARKSFTKEGTLKLGINRYRTSTL